MANRPRVIVRPRPQRELQFGGFGIRGKSSAVRIATGPVARAKRRPPPPAKRNAVRRA